MPQFFQILRCFQCLVFQVHQTKKSNKWECKLCGAKQSVKRHYGLGTAKDCRLHVQKLNGIRSEIDDLKESIKLDSDDEDVDILKPETKNSSNLMPEKSKWMEFVDTEEIIDEEVPPKDYKCLDGAKVVLEINRKRKKSIFKCPKKEETRSPAFEDCSYDKLPKHLMTPVTSKIREESKLLEEASSSNVLKEKPISNELLTKNKVPQVHQNKIIKVPVVNSCSKWAQFVDEEDDINNDDENETPPMLDSTQSSKSSLFNLCGDDDLDIVLDI